MAKFKFIEKLKKKEPLEEKPKKTKKERLKAIYDKAWDLGAGVIDLIEEITYSIRFKMIDISRIIWAFSIQPVCTLTFVVRVVIRLAMTPAVLLTDKQSGIFPEVKLGLAIIAVADMGLANADNKFISDSLHCLNCRSVPDMLAFTDSLKSHLFFTVRANAFLVVLWFFNQNILFAVRAISRHHCLALPVFIEDI